MKEWLRISCLLCICGFAREIRPSEPYLTEYLISSRANITRDVISQKVYPVVTYSYLATLVLIFLVTDFLRYKPLIILMGSCGTIVASMLLWTTTLTALQTMEFFYGLYLALEVAYYTYIYAKVDKRYYPKVTAHTRAAMFTGKLVAGFSSQLLINLKLMNYKSLHYITLSTQIFATLWAFTLPNVDKSLYFHRKHDVHDVQPTAAVNSSSMELQDAKSIKSQDKESVKPISPLNLLWSHFYNAYSNLKVVQWSIWYAVSLCGYLQIIMYMQVLWIEIKPNMEIAWNGAVDAVLTALAALMALAAGYIHAGRLKPLQSLLVLSIFAAMEGGAILLCCRTSNIYISYVGYILFGAFFAFSITVARDHDVSIRLKYVQHKGVKGIRNRKAAYESISRDENGEETAMTKDIGNDGNHDESANLDDRAYEELVSNVINISPTFLSQNVFIIQPYVKWGSERNTLSTPDDQLEEANALISSLPNWNVGHSIKIPLETLNRKELFGSGKIEELKKLLQEHNTKQTLTCLFISKSTLSFAQKRFLEDTFKLPVFDRYMVVIQILRLHATSAESRLQVAMAEIPYLWAQMKDANPSQTRKQGYLFTDTQRHILKTRERKLKQESERIRDHRKLLRNKRKQKNYPVIAVVGYTNAGKTSLIKALTHEQSMQPRNQLFATLDVTAHGGFLPCNLEVIYMDTVGFMSDLPTGLIECFVATLEDAMLADIILHVQDESHRCKEAQRQHVEATLQSLKNSIAVNQEIPPIINVANKIDLTSSHGHAKLSKDMFYVSATERTGLKELSLEIERQILTVTGRRKITMRVQNGGPEVAWLYKNTAVTNVKADNSSAEHLLITVVIDELAMQQFKREFLSANYS